MQVEPELVPFAVQKARLRYRDRNYDCWDPESEPYWYRNTMDEGQMVLLARIRFRCTDEARTWSAAWQNGSACRWYLLGAECECNSAVCGITVHPVSAWHANAVPGAE